MLKVVHFILDHRVGGPHAYVRLLAKMLEGQVESSLVTTGNGNSTQWTLTNLRHRLRWLYPIEVAWNVIRLCWHFRSKDSRRDCIFDVHGAANVAPLLAARLLGIPVVWHFHETLSSFRKLVEAGKMLLVPSRYKLVAVARTTLDVFGLEDAAVIPGAVDANYWQVPAPGRRAGNPGTALQVVTVGNLNPLKGADLLLDALAEFGQPWELLVVGSELATFREYGDMLNHKRRLLAGDTSKVQFLGWQPPEKVRLLLASADIFVLPSRSEACPIALLEAMAMECVCVATDVGDVPAIIDDPGIGIVVGSGSVGKLLKGLEDAFAMTATERSEMGSRARETVLLRYSQDKMAERHLEIYSALG